MTSILAPAKKKMSAKHQVQHESRIQNRSRNLWLHELMLMQTLNDERCILGSEFMLKSPALEGGPDEQEA